MAHLYEHQIRKIMRENESYQKILDQIAAKGGIYDPFSSWTGVNKDKFIEETEKELSLNRYEIDKAIHWFISVDLVKQEGDFGHEFHHGNTTLAIWDEGLKYLSDRQLHETLTKRKYK